jgi:hypothetical protein
MPRATIATTDTKNTTTGTKNCRTVVSKAAMANYKNLYIEMANPIITGYLTILNRSLITHNSVVWPKNV